MLIEVLEENINWLENTYKKIGNQIEVEYLDTSPGNFVNVKVRNLGLSDSMAPFKVEIKNKYGDVLGSADINQLRARSSARISIYVE